MWADRAKGRSFCSGESPAQGEGIREKSGRSREQEGRIGLSRRPNQAEVERIPVRLDRKRLRLAIVRPGVVELLVPEHIAVVAQAVIRHPHRARVGQAEIEVCEVIEIAGLERLIDDPALFGRQFALVVGFRHLSVSLRQISHGLGMETMGWRKFSPAKTLKPIRGNVRGKQKGHSEEWP